MGDIEITLRLYYKPQCGPSQDDLTQVKRDLTDLKIPNPKSENMKLLHDGSTWEMYWRSPRNNQLLRSISGFVEQATRDRSVALSRDITRVELHTRDADPQGPPHVPSRKRHLVADRPLWRPAEDDEENSKRRLRAEIGLDGPYSSSSHINHVPEEAPAAKRRRLSSFFDIQGSASSSNSYLESYPPLQAYPLQPEEHPLNVISKLRRELQDADRSKAEMQTRGLAENESLKSKLALAQQELQAAQRELQVERGKRRKTEATLDDIERECREPFVVPALLKAFLTISELTPDSIT